jgi:HEAT repeat protein
MEPKSQPPAAVTSHKVPGVRCGATNRAGNPCGRWAIPGGTVCPMHGGSAPQVREAARRRILTHAEQALETMVALLRSESDAVRVRAAADLLDRAGLKQATELAVSQADAPNAELDAAILAALEARGLADALPGTPQQAPDQD